MNIDEIYRKCLDSEFVTFDEAITLYNKAPLSELCSVAYSMREKIKGSDRVATWQIDRNVNITNVCVSGCHFCNFHCKPHQRDRAFITSIDDYKQKIAETLALNGDQLLLQGGMHPKLDIVYYETLFKELKDAFPSIKLHALGPPEVYHIARISGISTIECLERLISAGLSSFPGAGAEILDSDIRKKISPFKCSAESWLEIMSEAHSLNLATSATMMYGHIESREQRISHILKLRDLQAIKGADKYGFLAFIPWVFCAKGTELERQGVVVDNSHIEYLRIIAISRLLLPNIENIQASWLTMGIETGQFSLHCGANDLGSIMIEENVVSSAGANYRIGRDKMEEIIINAGFKPLLRDQHYRIR